MLLGVFALSRYSLFPRNHDRAPLPSVPLYFFDMGGGDGEEGWVVGGGCGLMLMGGWVYYKTAHGLYVG